MFSQSLYNFWKNQKPFEGECAANPSAFSMLSGKLERHNSSSCLRPFQAGNFFRDEEAYRILKNLADRYAILAETIDVFNPDNLLKVLSKHHEKKISYIDLGDLHNANHLGVQKTAVLMASLVENIPSSPVVVLLGSVETQLSPHFPIGVYGCFQFDPHFGATAEEQFKLGILDFNSQVRYMSPEECGPDLFLSFPNGGTKMALESPHWLSNAP